MATNQYRPDYAVAPGWILAERLEAQGISRAEVRKTMRPIGKAHQRDYRWKSPHRTEDGASV